MDIDVVSWSLRGLHAQRFHAPTVETEAIELLKKTVRARVGEQLRIGNLEEL